MPPVHPTSTVASHTSPVPPVHPAASHASPAPSTFLPPSAFTVVTPSSKSSTSSTSATIVSDPSPPPPTSATIVDDPSPPPPTSATIVSDPCPPPPASAMIVSDPSPSPSSPPTRILNTPPLPEDCSTSPEDQYAFAGIYYIKEWEDLGWKRCGILEVLPIKMPREMGATCEHFDERYDVLQKGEKKGWLVTALDDFTRQPTKYVTDYKSYIRHPKFQFDSSPAQWSSDKWKRNWSFVQLLTKHPRETRRVVYLDSTAALTTNMMVSSNQFPDKGSLIVPNPDPDFCSKAPADFSSRAFHYKGSLFEWMRDQADRHDDGYDFGADYCCTFTGNQSVLPKADLHLMFREGLLARNNGILWLTFSVRGVGKERTHHMVTTWLDAVSRHYGYNLELVESDCYHNMYYFFFVSRNHPKTE